MLPITNILQTNCITNTKTLISETSNSDFNKIIEKELDNISDYDSKNINSEVKQENEKVYVKDDLKENADIKSNEENVEIKDEKVESLNNNDSLTEEKEFEDIKEIEDITLLEQEVMKKLAEILNISEEEVLQLLNDNNMVFIDLFNTENIINLLKEYLNLSSDYELISNDNFVEKYKEIKLLMDETLEKNNFSDEEITRIQNTTTEVLPNEQVKEISQSEKDNETNFLQNDTTSNNKEIEIVDMRNNSSSNSGENANKQNDFQQIMSNVITEKIIHINGNGVEEVIYKNIDTNSVFNQVVSQMKIILTSEATSMLVKLQPESLGNVAFSVTSESGVITGRFVVENQAVKEIIDGNLANLKSVLSEQGIEVEEIEVVVGNTNQFLHQENSEKNLDQFLKSKTKKMTKISLESLEEEEEDNLTMSSLTSLDENHSIEFRA